MQPRPLAVKGKFSLSEFLAEARRRRVIRVLVLYAIAGWLIIQVASTVLPNLNVPPWSVTLVIVLVALGLPLAAILAWAFDVEDGRITRSGVADAGSEAAHGPACHRRRGATHPPTSSRSRNTGIALRPRIRMPWTTTGGRSRCCPSST